MEKYVTDIKDLVVQTLTSGTEIKAKAESGDALSCFQMGMIHLLGIDTPISYKKAAQYLGSQSLSDNHDANYLLGFIAECEGNYSHAFQNYAKPEGSDKDIYLDKVIKGRNHIQNYLKTLNLPVSLNKEISTILNDYVTGNTSKIDTFIKSAAICKDEPSCLEVAKNMYESNDYISAIRWLQKGNVGQNNPIYIAINDKFEKSKSDLLNSKNIQVLDLPNKSLLSNDDITPFLDKVKKSCDEASVECSKQWKNKSRAFIDGIIKKHKENEYNDYLQEQANSKRRNKIIMYAAAAIFVFVLGYVFSNYGKDSYDTKEPVKEEVVENNKVDKTNHVSQSSSNDLGYEKVLSERKLSDSDLDFKTPKELEIMRNSVYARYGYRFKREDLLNHFSQYQWYNPTTSDMSVVYDLMSDIEKYNVDFIKKHE